jgi:golgi apparatus protein 1
MSRIFIRLTPRLLGTCRENLQNYCDLPKNWSMAAQLSDTQVGMYLGCLYQRRQNVIDNGLSLNSCVLILNLQVDRECRTELKRLMRIRTQSIDLMPEIEENCIADLASCKNPEVKGEVRDYIRSIHVNLDIHVYLQHSCL